MPFIDSFFKRYKHFDYLFRYIEHSAFAEHACFVTCTTLLKASSRTLLCANVNTRKQKCNVIVMQKPYGN